MPSNQAMINCMTKSLTAAAREAEEATPARALRMASRMLRRAGSEDAAAAVLTADDEEEDDEDMGVDWCERRKHQVLRENCQHEKSDALLHALAYCVYFDCCYYCYCYSPFPQNYLSFFAWTVAVAIMVPPLLLRHLDPPHRHHQLHRFHHHRHHYCC